MKNMMLLFASASFCVHAVAQPPEGYLETHAVKVKMGKRMEFDAINKKMAELNRKNGAHWLCYEAVYGDTSMVYFSGSLPSYDAAARGIELFENALKKLGGEAAMRKLENDWDSTVESEHVAIYRRRWDLSGNPPKTMEEYNKLVGQARWIFVQTNYLRPGRSQAFAQELRLTKEAAERSDPSRIALVNQSAAGGDNEVFRTAFLLKSLDQMDSLKNIGQIRGESVASYRTTQQESVLKQETIIGRYLPELSNPRDEIVNVDPSFWRPKPAVAAKPTAANH